MDSSETRNREPRTEKREIGTRNQELGTLYVVGAGSGEPAYLTGEAREIITACRYIAGGGRLLELARELAPGAKTSSITADLQKTRAFIAGALKHGDVCVLTSGDPGCFSILPFLSKEFGKNIRVLPGISSVQVLAARLRLPWENWRLKSLHGRVASVDEAPSSPTAYFCDPGTPPQSVARLLLNELPDCPAAVGANLGHKEEMVTEGNLRDIAAGEFPGNSLLLVMPPSLSFRGNEATEESAFKTKNKKQIPRCARDDKQEPGTWNQERGTMGFPPGIPDHLWLRREGIPLSKSEVRAVVISKAQPHGRRVIWDVGAGSGSYGIECALLEPRAQVIAVDKNPAACHLVAANAQRFGARLEIFCAEAPEALELLAAPDLVIIGGNEGMLTPIFKTAARALSPGGRLVVTALLEETKKTAHRAFAESDLLNRSATRVAISRGKGHKWVEHNPVIVFTGDKS